MQGCGRSERCIVLGGWLSFVTVRWRCAVGWVGVAILLMTLAQSCKYAIARLMFGASIFRFCVVNFKTGFLNKVGR